MEPTHPLIIAGIFKPTTQLMDQELKSFHRDTAEQHEKLKSLLRAFCDFIKRVNAEDFEVINGMKEEAAARSSK